jgi:predicted nucleotidyltransferase
MGTTVWVDETTREGLRQVQERLGLPSVNATIQHLLERPAIDARTLFALHRDQIREILARHHLRYLVAFGSRARGDATLTSDLDLAVEAGPESDPLALLAAEAELETVLGLPVHLVERPHARLEKVIEREGVAFVE